MLAAATVKMCRNLGMFSVHTFAVKPVCYVEAQTGFILFAAELNSENQSICGQTLQKQVPERMNNMTWQYFFTF
jgi:hypothetical protein